MHHPVIDSATPAHRAAVEALLRASGLPLTGLDTWFPGGFAVARVAGELVGAAGSESYGEDALLRSVVVAPAQRGRGIAQALVADRIAWLYSHGARAVWLLTSDATSFFERLGFVRADRGALPVALQRSTQLSLPVCSTAVAMQLDLASAWPVAGSKSSVPA